MMIRLPVASTIEKRSPEYNEAWSTTEAEKLKTLSEQAEAAYKDKLVAASSSSSKQASDYSHKKKMAYSSSGGKPGATPNTNFRV